MARREWVGGQFADDGGVFPKIADPLAVCDVQPHEQRHNSSQKSIPTA
jgi:hypothetical protein